MDSPFLQITLHRADKFFWRKFNKQCVRSQHKLVHVIGKILGNTRQQVMHIAHLALTAQYFRTATYDKLKKKGGN